MFRKTSLPILIYFCFSLFLKGQNTIGVLRKDSLTSETLNLFFPFGQPNVYLIDNCGIVVNVWKDASNVGPGVSSYLCSNGNLLVCKVTKSNIGDTIKAGGGGELIELRNWENELLWSKKMNNGKSRFHHDAIMLPNGNILALAWENFNPEQALQSGRKADLITENAIWPDFIIEYNPKSDIVVWEWHAWDHLIQEYDSKRSNFGKVKEHPELININHISASGQADWMHSNSLHYIEEYDIIALSVAHFNEIWFLDHSTTIAEAKSHTGGRFNKGGDIIYRWGNPHAYGRGDINDQKLFFQHDVQWIRNGTFKGCISIFNNRVNSSGFSEACIFKPVFDEVNNNFVLSENGKYLPNDFSIRIKHPELPSKCLSSGLSSFQILNNQNYFIFSGNQGYGFELNKDGKIVWEYELPFSNGNLISQGESPVTNFAFKMVKYDKTDQIFEDKDIIGKEYLELNPDSTLCKFLTKVENIENNKEFHFNNIVNDDLNFYGNVKVTSYIICDVTGKILLAGNTSSSFEQINLSQMNSGIYFIKLNDIKMYPIFKL